MQFVKCTCASERVPEVISTISVNYIVTAATYYYVSCVHYDKLLLHNGVLVFVCVHVQGH